MKKHVSFIFTLLLMLFIMPYSAHAANQPADGQYLIEAALSGGTGRASIESPAKLTVKDGKLTAVIVWSSPNYDYMLVGGKDYYPVNTEGNSMFEIQVSALDEKIEISAETLAMGQPHTIDYTLSFDSASLEPFAEEGFGREAKLEIAAFALVIPVTAAVIYAILRRRAKMRMGVNK